MNDPTSPAHLYVRPGQVAKDRPPRDACVECGQPADAHRVRADLGGWISGPSLPTWHVLITAGDDVSSYLVTAPLPLVAAARAAVQHAAAYSGASIDDVNVEMWPAGTAS